MKEITSERIESEMTKNTIKELEERIREVIEYCELDMFIEDFDRERVVTMLRD